MKHIKVQRTFTRGIAEAEAFVYEKTELKASQNLLRDEFEIQDNLKFFEDAVNAVSEDLNELAEESAILRTFKYC